MVPIFKVNVESLIIAAKLSNSTLLMFLLENGIIYQCQTYYPGSCRGCIFDRLNFKECWITCDPNIIYKWNYQSKNYVEENEK